MAEMTPQDVTEIVSRHCGVRPLAILGPSQGYYAVRARGLAMVVCYTVLGMNGVQVSLAFNRERSAFSRDVDKIVERISTDPELRRQWIAIDAEITARLESEKHIETSAAEGAS